MARDHGVGRSTVRATECRRLRSAETPPSPGLQCLDRPHLRRQPAWSVPRHRGCATRPCHAGRRRVSRGWRTLETPVRSRPVVHRPQILRPKSDLAHVQPQGTIERKRCPLPLREAGAEVAAPRVRTIDEQALGFRVVTDQRLFVQPTRTCKPNSPASRGSNVATISAAGLSAAAKDVDSRRPFNLSSAPRRCRRRRPCNSAAGVCSNWCACVCA